MAVCVNTVFYFTLFHVHKILVIGQSDEYVWFWISRYQYLCVYLIRQVRWELHVLRISALSYSWPVARSVKFLQLTSGQVSRVWWRTWIGSRSHWSVANMLILNRRLRVQQSFYCEHRMYQFKACSSSLIQFTFHDCVLTS